MVSLSPPSLIGSSSLSSSVQRSKTTASSTSVLAVASQASSSSSKNTNKNTRPSLWKVWFVAARPHTLTASVAPNIVAYHLGRAAVAITATDEAVGEDSASYSWFRLTLEWTVFCMLIQLGTNLHNDYADYVKGADTEKRVGQARATQKGWLTPYQTAQASGLTLLVASLLGFMFVARLLPSHFHDEDDETAASGLLASLSTRYGPASSMLVIVMTSIFNAFAYTGGPWPLGYIGFSPDFSIGYAGLGDIFVFLYFGLVATLTPSFLYSACNNNHNNNNNTTLPMVSSSELSSWTMMDDLPYAIAVATLATNIIVVNNLRDRLTDVVANKRTVAVRFGANFCKIEYGINILIAYGIILWKTSTAAVVLLYPTTTTTMKTTTNSMILLNVMKQLLPFVSFPFAMKEWSAICTKDGSALNPHVGKAALVQLIFCILLAVSVRI